MKKLTSLVFAGFLNLNNCSPKIIHLPKTQLYDNDNKTVIFEKYPDHPFGASAYYNKSNKPIISYNPTWLGGFPKEFQIFLIYHEHGHIVLKHLDQNPYTRTKKLFDKNQYEADCYSIKHLRDNLNYSSEQFETIYNWADLTFETEERSNNLIRCLFSK